MTNLAESTAEIGQQLWESTAGHLSMVVTEVAAVSLSLRSGRAGWQTTRDLVDAMQPPLTELHLAIATIAVTNAMLDAGIIELRDT